MKRTKFKKGYNKKNGTRVSPHIQNYTYRDFAKFRLKKILAAQKQKNVMLAMKQMGKEWATAKTLKPDEIKKRFGSAYLRQYQGLTPGEYESIYSPSGTIARYQIKPSEAVVMEARREQSKFINRMGITGFQKDLAQVIRDLAPIADDPRFGKKSYSSGLNDQNPKLIKELAFQVTKFNKPQIRIIKTGRGIPKQLSPLRLKK